MTPPVQTPSHPDNTPDPLQPTEEVRENAGDNEGGGADVEREHIKEREEKHVFDKQVDNGAQTETSTAFT